MKTHAHREELIYEQFHIKVRRWTPGSLLIMF